MRMLCRDFCTAPRCWPHGLWASRPSHCRATPPISSLAAAPTRAYSKEYASHPQSESPGRCTTQSRQTFEIQSLNRVTPLCTARTQVRVIAIENLCCRSTHARKRLDCHLLSQQANVYKTVSEEGRMLIRTSVVHCLLNKSIKA